MIVLVDEDWRQIGQLWEVGDIAEVLHPRRVISFGICEIIATKNAWTMHVYDELRGEEAIVNCGQLFVCHRTIINGFTHKHRERDTVIMPVSCPIPDARRPRALQL